MQKNYLLSHALYLVFTVFLWGCNDDDTAPSICLPVLISGKSIDNGTFVYDNNRNLIRQGSDQYYFVYTYDNSNRPLVVEAHGGINCKLWAETYTYTNEYVVVSRQGNPLSCISDQHSGVTKYYYNNKNRVVKSTYERSVLLTETEYLYEGDNLVRKIENHFDFNGQLWLKDISDFEYDNKKSFSYHFGPYLAPEASPHNITKLTKNRYSANDTFMERFVYNYTYTYTDEGYPLTVSSGNSTFSYEYYCR